MITLAINGFCGKMGQRITALAGQEPDFKVVAGIERKGHPNIGKPAGTGYIFDDPLMVKKADVVIDFTVAECVLTIVTAAQACRKPIVIGTTGLNADQYAAVKAAAAEIPVVYSPNMSVGVHVLFRLVKTAAEGLSGYTIRIKEAHHIHKKDSPSGTAKKLASIAEAASGTKVSDIEALREGEIVGDHDIIFESDVDTLVLRHSAKTRDIFVKGALRAARWIAHQPAGLYSMEDVLA